MNANTHPRFRIPEAIWEMGPCTYSEADLKAMQRNEIIHLGMQAKKRLRYVKDGRRRTFREWLRWTIDGYLERAGYVRQPWMDRKRKTMAVEVAYNLGYAQGELDALRRRHGLPIVAKRPETR